jgi:hypothetical protein
MRDARVGGIPILPPMFARITRTPPDRVTVAFRELGEGSVWRRSTGEPEPAAQLSCDIRRGRPPERPAGDFNEAFVNSSEVYGQPFRPRGPIPQREYRGRWCVNPDSLPCRDLPCTSPLEAQTNRAFI